MSYEMFASVYDEVMDPALYEDWLRFSRRHLPQQPGRLLELACGTGALAVAFAKSGYQVTALDLSAEMLAIADQRADEAQADIQFVEGNMLDLSEIGQYDAVTCFSDSLCYMPDQQAVRQVFDEVFNVLADDGTFLFDVHSLHQVDTVFPGYSYHYQTDDFAFLWESYPGGQPHSVSHLLTFFVQTADEALFQRYDELHEERTYTLKDYHDMLGAAGFASVAVYGDFSDNSPDEETKRWFFVCRKA